MAVTRSDVARRAGTSPAVVSYVVNDGPRGVSPQTRDRVLAAIEELGYRPNRVAASLRTNRTMTLGLVVPDNANPFFAELARAVEEVAFSAGYTLLMGNATDDEARQTSYVRTFLERRVDGLLLIPSHGSAACLTELRESGTPWVVLDRFVHDAVAAQVLVDNRGGGRAATDHLLGHGRRRIACIAGPTDVAITADRVSGWRDALDNAGATDPPPPHHVPFGRFAGYSAARELLISWPDTDAIFVASDEQALGVLRALNELGLHCPDEVAVVSFDGVAASGYTSPALSTMRQPFTALAEAGLALLVRQLNEPNAATETVVLPAEFVARGSCGCPEPPGGGSVSLGGHGGRGSTAVAVVGSVNLDLVVGVSRLPRPGETMLGSEVQYRAGGKGANQSVAARRLGTEVALFGAVGDDNFGADLTTGLAEHGIPCSAVVDIPACPSGAALIVVQPDGENTVTVAPGANSKLTPGHLAELPRRLTTVDILLLQMEIPTDTNVTAATMARRAGITVMLNAAPLPDCRSPQVAELLQLADVLVVNEMEAGQLNNDEHLKSWGEQASRLRRWGPSVVVITLGENGAVVSHPDGEHVEPPFDATVVDGTGAGDAFCGALAVGLSMGKDTPAAVQWACAAGAIATTRVGAQSAAPTFDEVEEWVQQRNVAPRNAI